MSGVASYWSLCEQIGCKVLGGTVVREHSESVEVRAEREFCDELVELVKAARQRSPVAPKVETSNRFEWQRHGNPKDVGGYIALSKDANGLPVLEVNPDDDFYAGTLDHRGLFDLVTALALHLTGAT